MSHASGAIHVPAAFYNLYFFYLKLIFYIYLYYFDIIVLKIIFLKIKKILF